MKPFAAYSRRFERKRRLLSARLRYADLTERVDRSHETGAQDLLVFVVLRNEAPRLAYFLDYYRNLGADHFFIVDNGSSDGSVEVLENQPDVSLWTTNASYRRANFGVHWINALMIKHGRSRWCLVVDPDEFLVYPHMDTRDLKMLCEHLDAAGRPSLGTLLLDLYGEGPVATTTCGPGEDPVKAAPWFDPANYFMRRNDRYRNLWIQGGPRLRTFFPERPMHAPALNKIPLVRHRPGICFVSSTHAVLPRKYNITYDDEGGEKLTGVLLHTKFLSVLADKVEEEIDRGEHFAGGREYKAYADRIEAGLTLWTPHSACYEDWRQLVALGLMSRGGWL